MVNSQRISDHIAAALPILEVHITVESRMHWVSRSNVSDSSFSHWKTASVPWGAGVAGVADVLVANAAGAMGSTGPGCVMEPLRCPHTLSPFDFMAWVN